MRPSPASGAPGLPKRAMNYPHVPKISGSDEIDQLMAEPLETILYRIRLGLALLPGQGEFSDAWTNRVVQAYRQSTGATAAAAPYDWNSPLFKSWREDTRRLALGLVDRLLGTYDAGSTVKVPPISQLDERILQGDDHEFDESAGFDDSEGPRENLDSSEGPRGTQLSFLDSESDVWTDDPA